MATKVTIIGAGPAGYPAALKFKELGAEVTLIEAGEMGGTCLNRGCIPSKAFLNVAHRVHLFQGIENLMKENSGLNFNPEMLDWNKITAKRKAVSDKIRTSLERLFQSRKIEVIKGRARFSGRKEITVKTEAGEIKKEFDYAILASGTKPACPPPFNKSPELITDSDRVFDLPEKPEKAVIVGAGVIGLEFACFFNALGIDVTMLEIMPDMLPGEDPQVKRAIRSSFEKRGVKFIFGRKTETITSDGKIKTLKLDDGTELKADTVLVGAGRTADLSDMGLETVGLEWNRKGVKTDNEMRTVVPDIFAAGDVNGLSLLAHSASRQGEIIAENVMTGSHKTFDGDIVPKCIYAWPESASVGINKEAAEAKGIPAKTARVFHLAVGRAVASDETEGFVQIVWNPETDVIIGAQIVGGPATELIHVMALAVKLKLTRGQMKDMIFAHPTMAEALHEVLSK